ncbi:fibronectin type III-like domain-contianing protein [Catellatospora tritici]|uniref:fibronectin type III-like domain-contianing protein n=1 Tax=Catellatospora tritici TaxID=2851566 RepID=UPI001C2CF984|nr:fibronectin type III-like domain-contianing protein [Catellatospora tritici]MBV1850572.1 fibronectin type III-like domain-contianing protein [Catellatospora tritici]
MQLYVHDPVSSVHRRAQELKAFARVRLEPGQTREVALRLGRRTFAVWDVVSRSWAVEAGDFELRIGASSRDIRAALGIRIESDEVVAPVAGPAGSVATDEELAVLLGGPVPVPRPLLPYTTDSTIEDLGQTWLGHRLRSLLLAAVRKQIPIGDPDLDTMVQSVLSQMPLRGLVAAAGGASAWMRSTVSSPCSTPSRSPRGERAGKGLLDLYP